MADPGVLTLGDIARRYNVPTWMVRRLFESGKLPPAARVGAYRVVPAADLWRIERALQDANYLPKTEAACSS